MTKWQKGHGKDNEKVKLETNPSLYLFSCGILISVFRYKMQRTHDGKPIKFIKWNVVN